MSLELLGTGCTRPYRSGITLKKSSCNNKNVTDTLQGNARMNFVYLYREFVFDSLDLEMAISLRTRGKNKIYRP